MFQTLKATRQALLQSNFFLFVIQISRGVSPIVTILRAIDLTSHITVSVAQTHSHMPSLQRENLSDQTKDLEETPLSLPHHTRNGIQTLLGLALARLYRSKKYGEPEDVDTAIVYLRNLRDCPLGAFNVSQHTVTTSLVEMLAVRVKGEAGDALEDINEILFFCRGFTSDTSPGYLISALQALTGAVLDAYSRGKQLQSLDQAIGCLRRALESCSLGLHRVSFDLANLLAVRFLVHHEDKDYEDAKLLLEHVIDFRSPGDPPCSCRFEASALTAALGHARSIVNPNLEDFEKAVSRCRSFLDDSPLFGNPLHPVISGLLANHAERVSKTFAPRQGTQAVHSEVDGLPFSMQFSTFRDGSNIIAAAPSLMAVELEERIEGLRDLYSTTRPGTVHQRRCLIDLVQLYHSKIFLTDDTTFIEEAILYSRRLIATNHPTDQSKLLHVSTFGDFLYIAFDRAKKVEYLDESIILHREVLGLRSAQLMHFSIIQRLIWSLYTRWRLFRRGQDLDEVMCLFESYVRSAYATISNRFELAYRWAYTARIFGHHSLPIAYENVMSLMQSSLVFVPKLLMQCHNLVENRLLYEVTPLNFASHHVRTGQLEQAVEVLEQGRLLLWSEMRGFHTSTDRLRAADPDLAERLAAINQELEILTTSNRGVGMYDGEVEGDERMAQLPDPMEKQKELLKERDALISEIRGFSGLENFLLPLSFDALRSAASHGPVIIINHCKWRSDILIVLHDSPPSHIPTPYDFFDRANQLKDRLLQTRKNYGPKSKEHEDALSFVLMGLYELVGRPVIERLKRLGISEQSRVWWCPISVFGYLPLHAMGPIPSDSGNLRYFSDVYVSSYTPTLSALIASREPDAQASTLLTPLVAQPSPSPPGAWPDAQAHNLDLQAMNLNPGSTSSATMLEGLQRCQFACVAHRGELKTGKPFEAAMWLPDGHSLTLLDIVRSQHPAGESALLPGFYTAELTDGSNPDEAMQLPAAVQFSGFRSVIGTTWGMGNEDGRELAENVHRSMFIGKQAVEPYYERAARALQHAVQQMRPGPLVRWVNYVHYGA